VRGPRPLLFDEGLPQQVAQALNVVGWPANAVGLPGAPVTGSGDENNCQWCKGNGDAVLVTNDRGKKDREIRHLLAQHRVDAIFVFKNLRKAPARDLARAILCSEGKIDEVSKGKSSLHHRLRPRGGLDPL